MNSTRTRPANANPQARLPVYHPEYRYGGSKNPYAARLKELEGRVHWDHGTELHRGRWREAFPDLARAGHEWLAPERRELHVELGCNAGHVTLEWAARNARAAYVGVDWKFKPIFRAAEKAQKRGIENLLFFRAHSERVPFMFGPDEIDRLYLFFPDPWPRKKQWKNRFLTARALSSIAPAVRKDGIFEIRTDHPGYFEWMEAAVAEVTDIWDVIERTRDRHASHPDPKSLTIPDVTLFERLFIKDGIRINLLKLRRR